MNEEIVAIAKQYIKMMPRKRAEIIDLADLANCEVESGGESVDSEIELMVAELDEMHDQEYQNG